MSKSISILVNQYEWHKRDLLSLVFINICIGIFLYIYKLHYLIEIIIMALLCLKSISFARFASIIPSVNADFDRFSWKYLQGLAISRKELVLILSLSRLLVLIPFIFWIISFFPQLNNLFNAIYEFKVSSLLKLLSVVIPLIIISGFVTIGQVISFPRTQFQKKNSKEVFYLSIRNILSICVVVLYTVILYSAIDKVYDLRIGYYFDKLESFIEYFLVSWWMPVALIIFGYLNFNNVLNIWKNEKLSYKNHEWKPCRDLSISLASIILIAIPLWSIDFSTPEIYQGDKILKLIYDKDIRGIESYVEKKGEGVLTVKNKYGFTPLLVAVHEGNIKIYNILKNLGVKYGGETLAIEGSHHNGMNIMFLSVDSHSVPMIKQVLKDGGSLLDKNKVSGNSLIHLAASTCRTKIVDYLIKHGVNVNAKTNKGLTPAHIVSKERRCFGPMVALFEAGADLNVKNADGKLPIDLANKERSVDLYYYLKKHSRKPASDL